MAESTTSKKRSMVGMFLALALISAVAVVGALTLLAPRDAPDSTPDASVDAGAARAPAKRRSRRRPAAAYPTHRSGDSLPPALIKVSITKDGEPHPAELFIDGRLIGSRTAHEQSVRAGRHDLKVVGRRGLERSVTIDLRPGEHKNVKFTFD